MKKVKIFTLVCLCLLVFTYVLPLFTHVYLCLPPLSRACSPLFSSCLLMFTHLSLCLTLLNCSYLCLLFFTNVYHCLLVHCYIYCNAVLKSIIIPRVTIVRKRGDTDTQSHTSHTPTHSLSCPCPIVNTLL